MNLLRGLNRALLRRSVSFAVLSLFADGVQGAWYDPSDLSSMFQDSAGTTPVYLPGQGAIDPPVGKILDKSGRGNHALQATAASRPVLSGRVNQLIQTGDPTNVAWTKTNVTCTAGATDPDGGSTAFTVTATAGNGELVQLGAAGAVGTPISIYVKRRTGSGTVDLYTGAGYTPIAVTSSWAKYTVSQTTAAAAYLDLRLVTNGDAVDVWHPQTELATTGVATRYQRVDTASTYDTAGFPLYLKFDGVDDSLATVAIDLTTTDKVTVWAGVQKLSNAASGVVCEFTNTISNPGSFSLQSPFGAAANHGFYLSGSAAIAGWDATTYTAPVTDVLSCVFDIAGATRTQEVMPRINGAVPTLGGGLAGPSGTGNFANAPLYIGGRAVAGNSFLNGRMYQLIVRGTSSTAAQIVAGETFTNTKTGAY